ncbi:HlyD family secretion protein [Blastopirellula marina]|uniref:HlyD family secretion protein n=2 Tax=Pirellulales TaxID=2691354 RepID=A0A2S8FEZ5_9BACT|nr:HlyD family secretion protein [Blastopirellula marina]RCS50875.1 HlyD family secretion protein [Bremerella cremea]
MIILCAIFYVLTIWLVYAVLKIKPRPVNLGIFAAIGVIVIGGIVIFWQFSSPTSSQVVVSRYTVQIVPQVKGHISKIVAEANVPVKKGDVLFEIEKAPFQYALNETTASLGVAQKTVEQLRAGIKVAEANVSESQSKMEVAKADLDFKEDVNKRSPGTVSALNLAELRAQYAASQAVVEKTKAALEESKLALEVADQQVRLAKANVDTAQFNLDQCTYTAPSDGFVTNWQAREGTMAITFAIAPVGTFIDTSQIDVVAVFGQNVLKNVEPGNKVEVALKNHPGQVFSGKVANIIEASGEGQFVTSGKLIDASSIHSSGKFAVKIELDDEALVKSLPMGTAGMVTIYTDSGKPFQIISKVTVRIKACMYYLNLM